jgi:hypothetical protein
MKQLLIKYRKWWYALSVALGIGTVALAILGGHDDLDGWMFVGCIALALLVADATGQLKPFKKHKD